MPRQQTDAQRKATKKYHSERIDTIAFHVQKGKKDILKKEASSRNMSLNVMIDTAIDEFIENHPIEQTSEER